MKNQDGGYESGSSHGSFTVTLKKEILMAIPVFMSGQYVGIATSMKFFNFLWEIKMAATILK